MSTFDPWVKPPSPFTIGDLVDRRWLILEPEVGGGNQSWVHKAQDVHAIRGDTVDGATHVVALKVLADAATDWREPQALLKLGSAHVIGVWSEGLVDAGPALGHKYLTMDWAEGSLLQLLQARAEIALIDLAQAMIAGLRDLHLDERLHRDVKPGNVLLVRGRWVLGDLGLTSVLGGADLTHASLTGGVIRGTPAFLAPELTDPAWTRGYTKASDIWALGRTLQVAVNGQETWEPIDPVLTRLADVIRLCAAPRWEDRDPDRDPTLWNRVLHALEGGATAITTVVPTLPRVPTEVLRVAVTERMPTEVVLPQTGNPPSSLAELVLIESVHADSVPGDEIATWAANLDRVIDERETTAAFVARSNTGDLLTAPGFADEAWDRAADGLSTVFTRRMTGDCWVESRAADYFTAHWPGASEQTPAFRDLEWSRYWLYVDRSGVTRTTGLPRSFMFNIGPSRISTTGGTIAYVEHRGLVGGDMLWVERGDGTGRRAVASQPTSMFVDDISLSADGRWVVWGNGPPILVDLTGGRHVPIPNAWTASFSPWHGPSTLLVVSIASPEGPSTIRTLDLATDRTAEIAVVPTRVDAVESAADGRIAVVHRHQSIDEGGMRQCSYLDGPSGRLTPVLRGWFDTGALRLTKRPRWVERLPPQAPVQLSETWREATRAIEPVQAEWLDHPEGLDRMMRRRVRRLSQTSDVGPVLAEIVELTRVWADQDSDFRSQIDTLLIRPLEAAKRSRPQDRPAFERSILQLAAIAVARA